jgi:hypothetical protein
MLILLCAPAEDAAGSMRTGITKLVSVRMLSDDMRLDNIRASHHTGYVHMAVSCLSCCVFQHAIAVGCLQVWSTHDIH